MAAQEGREGVSPTYKPVDLSRHEGHTPGPWGIDIHGWAWLEADGAFSVGAKAESCSEFVVCGRNAIPLKAAESQANARLIADAPALRDEVVALREENARLRQALGDLTEAKS